MLYSNRVIFFSLIAVVPFVALCLFWARHTRHEADAQRRATEKKVARLSQSKPEGIDIVPCRTSPKGMVLIPAGEFEMGINYVDASPNDEQPVYTVYVNAFFIDRNEVTNAEYKQFIIENPQWEKEHIDDRLHNGNYLVLLQD